MSEKVIGFCKSRGTNEKEAFYAGLAIEEMAGNIIQHGFVPGKKQVIEVRVVKKENTVIRIQDNCPLFDPAKRVDQFYPEDICKNIGIRMVSGVAKDMNYQSNVGINTLLITV
jgi:anti-sigma regulatory factor (Ser/Thr protein kinase)